MRTRTMLAVCPECHCVTFGVEEHGAPTRLEGFCECGNAHPTPLAPAVERNFHLKESV